MVALNDGYPTKARYMFTLQLLMAVKGLNSVSVSSSLIIELYLHLALCFQGCGSNGRI